MKSVQAEEIIFGHGNTFHDPAICIFVDGKIYAEAIERHMQCKRGFDGSLWYSAKSIQSAAKILKIDLKKVKKITKLSCWDPKLIPESEFLVRDHLMIKEAIVNRQLANIFDNKDLFFHCSQLEQGDLVQAKTIEHHLSHAANAVYTSPFEDCVVMVLDGTGEVDACKYYHFNSNKFHLIQADYRRGPNYSPGWSYGLITGACGFSYTEGEEWKLMGLAAYGKFCPDLHNFFKEKMIVKDLVPIFDIWDVKAQSSLKQIVGGFREQDDPEILRMADMAFNFQARFSEVLVEIAKQLFDLNLSKNLAFAGGCALNSSANAKIADLSGFSSLHVPSAPADDGNALGAALYENHSVRGLPRKPSVGSPYLGSLPNIESLERILGFGGIKYEEFDDPIALCETVATFLQKEKIVGWMQGRAEFGPRALGNRSIIASPCPANMQDRINSQIKFRESYRPLAPSILHEFGHEFFENYVESPYMDRALTFKKEARAKVPAVVHKDGTGRLQTVKEEWNPLFYQLINAFYRKTGIPLLVNTSFNVMGKPIVHSVEDAITVFFTTGLEYLVVENYILYK